MQININTDLMSAWIKARAIERSTWEGIIGTITIIASYIKPEYTKIIASSGAGIWSLIRMITKDSTSTLGKTLAAAAQAHDELIVNVTST